MRIGEGEVYRADTVGAYDEIDGCGCTVFEYKCYPHGAVVFHMHELLRELDRSRFDS